MLHLTLELLRSTAVPDHYGKIATAIVLILLIHSWARGPALLEREERIEAHQRRAHEKSEDVRVTAGLGAMGGRTVLMGTGAMTPIGLVVMAMLAQQGAHIVALVPDAAAENVVQLVLLLRESTSNENIFAESCDVRDDASITAFAKRWHEGAQASDGVPSTVLPGLAKPHTHRLDVLLFLPSAEAVPVMGATTDEAYTYTVLARFRLVKALLPSLLAQPPSRDVRIVSAVSPWYAAGLAQFDRIAQPPKGPIFEPWTRVGAAELHWIHLAMELQHRLDKLAESDTRPRTDLHGIDDTLPPLAERRSHVSSVIVCPGFEVSQLSAFFGGPAPLGTVHRAVLWALWLAMIPALWLLGKPTSRAADAMVWAARARRAPAARARPRTQNAAAERSDDHLAQQWPGLQPGLFALERHREAQ
ncbi:hypothetical protein MCAP1_001244 [Malassezia caprae]|uniref:Uncharacterized protein n=1 Tax=Malassezia caprae TaxID=1381934 RepID=A0AAF0IUQ2_9BASI|nr:hypothetical protein MCAP1_001244 [Malassezia caprae]